MATTETRTGFRLPWSSEHRATDSAPAPDTSLPDEPVEASPEAEGTDVQAPTVEDPAVAGTDPGTDPGPDAASGTIDGGADPAPVTPEAEITETPMLDTPAAPSAPQASPVAARRPTKFLADLTNAMRTTAEAERVEILERFNAEAKAAVEQVHERSGTETADLRQHADDDVTGIHDRSESEIVRIREETEERIAARRAVLDRELEEHAARVERTVERVSATVDDFEASMSRFFEALLVENDPSSFAELAANLPEPPSLEVIVGMVDDGHVVENAIGTVAAVDDAVATVETSGDTLEAAFTSAPFPTDEPALYEHAPETLDGDHDQEPAGAAPDVEQQHGWDAVATWPTANETESEPGNEPGGAPESEPESERSFGSSWAVASDTTEDRDESSDAGPAPELEPESDEPSFDLGPTMGFGAVDPRVAALGLSPDHAAAAETEALRDADDGSTEDPGDEVPPLDDATIAARLAGLPQSGGEGMASVTTTQVVVTGLVSVASIAGFKRHLGRLRDVRSVGVSSGPEGEFLFSVTHGDEAALHDAIPTLPGFAARVTGSGAGVLNVTARDPEAGA